jgi:putative ABC transport system substrate-binding protein
MISPLSNVAVMWNPDHPLHLRQVEDLKSRAPFLAIELSFVAVRRAEQLEQAFSEIAGAKAQALYVVEDPLFFAQRESLLELASAARLPTLHDLRRFPEVGALMSYGPDLYDLFRRSSGYVDRMLKGAKRKTVRARDLANRRPVGHRQNDRVFVVVRRAQDEGRQKAELRWD